MIIAEKLYGKDVPETFMDETSIGTALSGRSFLGFSVFTCLKIGCSAEYFFRKTALPSHAKHGDLWRLSGVVIWKTSLTY
jgi:hypothetical protein